MPPKQIISAGDKNHYESKLQEASDYALNMKMDPTDEYARQSLETYRRNHNPLLTVSYCVSG